MWTPYPLLSRSSMRRRAESRRAAGLATACAPVHVLVLVCALALLHLQSAEAQTQTQTQTAPFAASTPQPTFDLSQLMRSLAAVKSGTARFVETRHVAMLERTLESSGRLSFEAPDRFTRETLKPRYERFAVAGNTVTVSQGAGTSTHTRTRTRSLALDTVPEAAVVVVAIRGTLTGNRDALEQHFSASLGGTAQRWTLDLVPRDWRLREQVAAVRVRGARAQVREVTVTLTDGDRSVMVIEPLLEPLSEPLTGPLTGPSSEPLIDSPATPGPLR